MLSPRAIVNFFSLSRIGFALILVVLFQRDSTLLYICLALVLLALATDIVDGYLSRKFQVASIQGRLWDSLGDKTFYAAIIIAFHAHGFLGTLVSWGLIVREIALYITRLLFVEKLPEIERIRPWTNWHGYFMYLTIIFGFWRMWAEIHGIPFQMHTYMQMSAYAALACGIGSIFHFLKLSKGTPG